MVTKIVLLFLLGNSRQKNAVTYKIQFMPGLDQRGQIELDMQKKCLVILRIGHFHLIGFSLIWPRKKSLSIFSLHIPNEEI